MLGAIAGTFTVMLKTPLYQAGTTVVFNQGSAGMSQSNSQGAGGPVVTLASTIQTQIAILTSRTLINSAVQRMNLELTPQLSAPATVLTRLRNRIPFLRQDPQLQSRQAVAVAASTTSAKPIVGTQIIQIQCSSTSPEVAAIFVNTLANAYQSLTQSSNSTQTQQRSQWIESQLEESKVRLQQANENLRTFVQKSGMNFVLAQTNLEDSKMGSLRGDVAAIQAIRIQKQSLWELAKSTSSENLPDVMNDQSLLNLKGAINEQRRQMAQLLTTLTSEDPKVKKIQVQIDELGKNLQQAEVSLLRRMQSDYEEALSDEKKLTAAYNAQIHSASAQADKSAEYAMLSREVDTDQTLYNNLMQQSGQAALMALAPSGSIQIIDLAYPPFIPSSPKPKTEIPTWAFAGGVIGYGLLLLRELLRRRRLDKLFESPGYTQTVLGVPELGVIPSTQITRPSRRFFGASGRRAQLTDPANDADLVAGNGHSPSGALVTGSGNQSMMLSESFRQTLVSLLRTKPRGHSPVYVITSAGPGEGKTTFSVNLARAMAEIGQRVLLVDADLRRPHVHSLLDLGEHLGLSDILASPAEVGGLELESFIQHTSIDDLSVMRRTGRPSLRLRSSSLPE